VAFESLARTSDQIFAARFVMGERDRAVLAFKLLPAGAAEHRKRIPTAVKQNDGLLAAFERLASLVDKGSRE